MENKASLVFTGDIGFDRYMDGKWEDEELLSLDILDYLNRILCLWFLLY